MGKAARAAVGVFLFVALIGCGRLSFEALVHDAAIQEAGDAAPEADSAVAVDAGHDATPVGSDAGAVDAHAPDADTLDATASADAQDDATHDAANDAGNDAANDAGNDSGQDAGAIGPTYPLVTVPALSSTGYHTCVVRSGALYCWGKNLNGQLGTGDNTTRATPVQVTLPTGGTIVQVSAGEEHACAIEQGTGALYCWGANGAGELGLGDRVSRNQPTRVSNLPPVLQVSAGYLYTCAITVDNALYCWGDNNEGALGLDDAAAPIASIDTPTRSGSTFDWIQIATGQGRACGLRAPGTLWCVGRHGFYGFGDNSNTPLQIRAWTQSSPETDWLRLSVSQDGACGLRADNHAYCWGTFATNPPTVQMTQTRVTNALWSAGAAGVFNAGGVQQDGSLRCWGRNVEGQLGTGDWNDRNGAPQIGTDTDWRDIAFGRFHTCAQKQNGSVHCTGENADSQLGLGDTARRNLFTPVTLP